MNVAKPEKIVVLGIMTDLPVAGLVWQTVHYLVGLQRLGYERMTPIQAACLPLALPATT